tara:strand:- start:28 stop:384 length:357 start_codon:yes stop_codon:yes gene_type:complete
MNLKDYIEKTVEAILDATSAVSHTYANRRSALKPGDPAIGFINPIFGNVSEQTKLPTTVIEFDVATTTGESLKGEAGGSIQILSLKGDIDVTHSNVNRIRFSIPVSLPHDAVSGLKRD